MSSAEPPSIPPKHRTVVQWLDCNDLQTHTVPDLDPETQRLHRALSADHQGRSYLGPIAIPQGFPLPPL